MSLGYGKMKERYQLLVAVLLSCILITIGSLTFYRYEYGPPPIMYTKHEAAAQHPSEAYPGTVTPIPPPPGSVLPQYLPSQCEKYDGASQNFSLEDIIVRSVYFDDRQRGGHMNISVFLIEVRISILKHNLIVGCAVGEHVNMNRKKFEVHHLIQTGWVHHAHPELSHDTVFVNCFDMPAKNGSRGFVLYRRHTKDDSVTCSESEHNLMIPAPHLSPPQNEKFTITICCAPVYGTPPLLTEWLHYQKTIGIDHVHLIVEDSFTKKGAGIENKELQHAIKEGFVTIDVWKQWLKKSQVFYHSQVLAHEDCIYRYRGTYDYIMLLDVDEFFTPRVINENRIQYYVRRCCGNSCGSCHFHEYMYYPDCGLKGKVGKDGNITAQLVSYAYRDQAAEGKSFHRSSAIVDTGCQMGLEHMKGYRSVEFPMQLAYVAHVRKGLKPRKC